jgi:hypothetical protein
LHTGLCDPNFTERFASYLRSFRPDPDERRAAMRACYASSLYLGVATGQGGQSVEDKNAHAIARLTKELMVRYRDQLSCLRE